MSPGRTYNRSTKSTYYLGFLVSYKFNKYFASFLTRRGTIEGEGRDERKGQIDRKHRYT